MATASLFPSIACVIRARTLPWELSFHGGVDARVNFPRAAAKQQLT